MAQTVRYNVEIEVSPEFVEFLESSENKVSPSQYVGNKAESAWRAAQKAKAVMAEKEAKARQLDQLLSLARAQGKTIEDLLG